MINPKSQQCQIEFLFKFVVEEHVHHYSMTTGNHNNMKLLSHILYWDDVE